MKTLIHLILVRPLGSGLWTVHMKKNGVPWRSNDAVKADKEAKWIVDSTRYCARVASIAVPAESDSEQSAVMADGKTTYRKMS